MATKGYKECSICLIQETNTETEQMVPGSNNGERKKKEAGLGSSHQPAANLTMCHQQGAPEQRFSLQSPTWEGSSWPLYYLLAQSLARATQEPNFLPKIWGILRKAQLSLIQRGSSHCVFMTAIRSTQKNTIKNCHKSQKKRY